MRALSFSRKSLVLNMAICLLILWIAISPKAIDAKSLVGGWSFVSWGTCCNGDGSENCGAHPGCVPGDPAAVCYVSSPYYATGTCQPLGGNPCTDDWNDECDEGVNTYCPDF